MLAALAVFGVMQTMRGQTTTTQTAEAPQQPINFSHKIHAGGQQMGCDSCHTPTRSGENYTIPQAGFCMQCHAAIATDKPEIKKLAEYASTSDTIPWVRVYELPSFVNFSHRTHAAGNVACVECHGAVAEREHIYRETEMTMARCVSCHQAKKAAVGCDTCHTLQK